MDSPIVYHYQLSEEQFSSILNLAHPFFRFASRDGKQEFLCYDRYLTFSSLEEVKLNLPLLKTDVPETRNQLCAFIMSPYISSNQNHTHGWFLPKIQIHRGKDITAFVLNDDRPLIDIVREVSVSSSYALLSKEKKRSLNPTYDEWNRQIRRIQEAISKKQLTKVVLSRQEFFPTNVIHLQSIFDRMKRFTNQCYLIQFCMDNGYFFSVTPECLLYVNNDKIWVDSLAGSQPIGGDTSSDEQLMNRLLHSLKEQSEHKIVKQSIFDTLRPYLQTNAKIEETMSIKKLGYIQHLYTSIHSNLDVTKPLQRLIYDLHPTPAICGFPKLDSIRFLEQIAEPERGYYGGYAGWCNQTEVELAVLIRSALLSSSGITIYGGAGIVEGSDAESEWKETELKMSIMKQIFSETNTNDLC